MSNFSEITVYTDGACRGNPGPGGYGAILRYTDEKEKLHEKELAEGFRSTTNNRMELMGPIKALEALKRPCRVELYTDSSYVANAFNQGWLAKWQRLGWVKDLKKKEPVKNRDLWERLLEAMKPHEVTYHWVKGHADNEFNNRCDELAVKAALDKEGWKEDNGVSGVEQFSDPV